MTTEFSESQAQQIADRGRDVLIDRLRPAFYEVARQHADILKLDDEQIEQMVQRAADRADGLQWRRAFAWVATQELGMSLGQALSAPVVVRAQELSGAPSYEEALAALGLDPAAGRTAAAPTPADEPLTAADPLEPEPEPEPEPGDIAQPDPEPVADSQLGAPATETALEPEPGPEVEADESADGEPDMVRLEATHLGGIATLEAGEQNLELRIGAHGLDIARRPGRVLGRLRWREIRTLEVQAPRGLRRRRRADRSHLVVRTEHGDASFEVNGTSEESLRESLAPLLEHYVGS